MIICTDLPASVSPCAAAGITGASVSADANASAVSFGRLGRMRSLASGLLEHDLFRKPVPTFRDHALEIERRADRDHPRIRPEAAVGVEDAAAGSDDILQFRLQHPPRRELRLIHHLDRGFSAAYRIEEVSEEADILIESARVVAHARISGGDPDLVVRPARHESFVEQAAVGIEADQVAIVRHAAGAKERRKALVLGARDTIEHLIDHAVEDLVAGVIERNAGGGRTRERLSRIVVTLIAEARTGVPPAADPVGARKPIGILALVGQVARLGDDEGAAAEAENGAGRKRLALIGAVAAAG